MRSVVTSVAEIVGALSVSTGAFLWDASAGLVVIGVFLLAFARQAVRS